VKQAVETVSFAAAGRDTFSVAASACTDRPAAPATKLIAATRNRLRLGMRGSFV
jgi:hypothetical protein